MKIALVQLNPLVGDIAGNRKKILSIAHSHSADLFVFPELSITGYCPQDLLLKKQFIQENLDSLKEITKKTSKNIILGFVDQHDKKIYNAAAFISGKRIKYIYHKQELPNYSVFDEKRWFTAGRTNGIFVFNGKKIALNICEDIWTTEVCREQMRQHPDVLINISASPYSDIKFKTIESILLKRNKETKKPILYVNQVGAQDGLVYYGNSMFIDQGKIVKKATDFKEDILMVDLK